MQDQVQMSETRPAKIRDGCVWYAALLPAFALLLERYALNKYLGILVWAIALLMRPVCCFLDRKQLIAAGRPEEDPYLPLLPTVYLFKRCMALRRNTAIVIVCIISLGYGIVGNGFVAGMSIDDDTILAAVKGSSISSVDNVTVKDSYLSMGDYLDKKATDVKWEIVSSGDVRTVTVSGKIDSEPFSLEFQVVHDGYTYTKFTLQKLIKNSAELKGDDRIDLLKKLFTDNSQ
ncbi:MAG: hypothetical protein IKN17_11070 [Ruminococcus sp.]|nr:hypothetical protein [Ruminococcus sp.]